jgi:hypothetical protein
MNNSIFVIPQKIYIFNIKILKLYVTILMFDVYIQIDASKNKGKGVDLYRFYKRRRNEYRKQK